MRYGQKGCIAVNFGQSEDESRLNDMQIKTFLDKKNTKKKKSDKKGHCALIPYAISV